MAYKLDFLFLSVTLIGVGRELFLCHKFGPKNSGGEKHILESIVHVTSRVTQIRKVFPLYCHMYWGQYILMYLFVAKWLVFDWKQKPRV